MDYRLKENRVSYFQALYAMNLEYKVHPGLVYLYMPALRDYYGWNDEQCLWFATINGHTQNPITSMRIMEAAPQIPEGDAEFRKLHAWFNEEWTRLSFDSDRNKQKKDTIAGFYSYAELVKEYGSQDRLWACTDYSELWKRANSIKSFGRLSTFSYLEYVQIYGYGADCETLMFNDHSGSRSHRNGMFFLLGMDDYVFDKRQPNPHDGKYDDFEGICEQLEVKASKFIRHIQSERDLPNIGRFTFESCLCQFKNGFFSRRYPGVYADMGWDRINWYDSRGMNKYTEVFKAIRAQYLPDWLREECEKVVTPRDVKAGLFAVTGSPYRAEHLNIESE